MATEADLDNWLSPAAADRLRIFSASANKGTGASHPSDRERWNEFVLIAQREHSSLSSFTLRRWLIEVESWPPEIAELLAIEYGYGRGLLAFSEGRRTPDTYAQSRERRGTDPSETKSVEESQTSNYKSFYSRCQDAFFLTLAACSVL